MAEYEFEFLGKKISRPVRKLETFPKPDHVTKVVLDCDEVTSLCPVTGQPDWETVHIEFEPDKTCIESKSLKLYLWTYREEGAFCEALSAKIAQDIFDACAPKWVRVSVAQKARGGIAITAESRIPDAAKGT
jgi:7-cyano-7-deazaguanine reductase